MNPENIENRNCREDVRFAAAGVFVLLLFVVTLTAYLVNPTEAQARKRLCHLCPEAGCCEPLDALYFYYVPLNCCVRVDRVASNEAFTGCAFVSTGACTSAVLFQGQTGDTKLSVNGEEYFKPGALGCYRGAYLTTNGQNVIDVGPLPVWGCP